MLPESNGPAILSCSLMSVRVDTGDQHNFAIIHVPGQIGPGQQRPGIHVMADEDTAIVGAVVFS